MRGEGRKGVLAFEVRIGKYYAARMVGEWHRVRRGNMAARCSARRQTNLCVLRGRRRRRLFAKEQDYIGSVALIKSGFQLYPVLLSFSA